MRHPQTRAWSKLIKSNTISALWMKQKWCLQKIFGINWTIAYKLYHLNLEFNQLTPQELKFWKQFKQGDFFEWLSGSPIHPPDYSEYIKSDCCSQKTFSNHNCNLHSIYNLNLNNQIQLFKTQWPDLVLKNQVDPRLEKETKGSSDESGTLRF